MNTEWKYAADGEVLAFVADSGLKRSERRGLRDAFERLVRDPAQPSDLLGYDDTGTSAQRGKRG